MAIRTAVEQIQDVHAFHGITFLVFKEGDLPVAEMTIFPINSAEEHFMDRYYKPYTDSGFYYRAFRTSDKEKNWLRSDYPSSGSQSVRTRGRKARAFLHETNTDLWGWSVDYLQVLREELYQRKKIPLFYLAVWMYRDVNWPVGTHASNLVIRFINQFNLTGDELQAVFDLTMPDLEDASLFQLEPVSLKTLKQIIGVFPDMTDMREGALRYLELRGVGPSEHLVFEPGNRLSLITGDNGLGKSFLLEIAWWALTGRWVDRHANPIDESESASISFAIGGEESEYDVLTKRFDRKSLRWEKHDIERNVPGLIIYAGADNSFAIWDPAKYTVSRDQPSVVRSSSRAYTSRVNQPLVARAPIHLSPVEVLEGSRAAGCSGLIADWYVWQLEPDDVETERMFEAVLKRLSPSDMVLRPGGATRLNRETSRRIPTVSLPYGEVPIVLLSEGMRRILSLAYLLVWTWAQHKALTDQMGVEPQTRMIILIDEIEAHLHPRWQRLILPALLDVQSELSLELQTQFLITTHSPLVMASAEPIFDFESDKLFLLDLDEKDMFEADVHLKEIDFIREGEIDDWLTSPIFNLKQPQNVQAEAAIEDAKRLQSLPKPSKSEIQAVHERLVAALSAENEFWPRWLYWYTVNTQEGKT